MILNEYSGFKVQYLFPKYWSQSKKEKKSDIIKTSSCRGTGLSDRFSLAEINKKDNNSHDPAVVQDINKIQIQLTQL